MRSLPARLLFVIFLSALGCRQQSLDVSELPPRAVDGVLHLRMNHIAHDDLLTGEWSAPRLGGDRQFFRSPTTPMSGITFQALKREVYIVEVDLAAEVPSLRIEINAKAYPVAGSRFRQAISADDIRLGDNPVRFLFLDSEKIEVKQVRIHPRRFRKLADRYTPGSDFLTPVQFHYYCNPLQGSNLDLSYIFQGPPIEGHITLRSEKNTKEYTQAIQSRRSFRVPMLDDSLHHIRITIPEIDSPYIRLVKSRLAAPFERIPPSPSFESPAADTNILIVLLDAARADHMSCYGYHRRTTPHIDRLAAGGIRFDDVLVEAAYTLASTGTLLTGLPPDVHGVVSSFYSSLSSDITTLPELLQERGYATAALTANPFFGRAYNYHRGFDHFVELFEDKQVVTGDDFVAPFEELVEGAGGKPFFMYLHLREPHTPYSMPEPYFGMFQDVYGSPSESFHKEINRLLDAEHRNPSELRFMTDVYDENLAYADHIVGKLMEVLQHHQEFDNTLTVIISDHGEGLGEHGLLGHNVVLNREGIQVPLILHLPGMVPEPTVIANPAITSDLVVTLCELLKIDYPYPKLSRGRHLFSLPSKRIRFCRSTVLSSRYSGYAVDSFPYQGIFFPEMGRWDTRVFDIRQDPEARNPLPAGGIQEEALSSFLFRFIESSATGFRPGDQPKLGEKERDRLRALGYIK